ncbi:MAG: Hpt domain-containing protein, partial [Desulfuromonadales bacterium]|nr:Hpt domain-containing protein [Desulfuromonadales bacterium]
MDMSQYRALFLSETREHLNNLNKLTVALEQTPDDRETVNALFREAHSIKGMAATMGFEQTTRLAHRLEDMLDAFRSGGAIPSGIIDYLLSGIDLLEELLGDLEGNRSERDIEAFLRSSPDSDAQDADAATLPGDDEPEFAADVNDLVDAFAIQEESAADNGTTDESDAFQVLIDIAEGAAVAAARGLLALRELEKAGSLISSKPT